MNVDHPIGKLLEQRIGDHREEPREDHEVDVSLGERLPHFSGPLVRNDALLADDPDR